MTKKTVKDLDMAVSQLKEELKTLKANYDTLADKYETLEKRYEVCLNEKNQIFKCTKCDEEFISQLLLKKHRKCHNRSNELLQCGECEKSFDEEWKLNAHVKSHVKYSCDKCDQSFRYQEIKEKHVKIMHENLKLYCNFFNNNQKCPFDDKCIFLHEDSETCRYGKLCERTKCMYKHEEKVDDTCDTEDVDEDEHYENESDQTFINPFLSGKILHCDICDYKTLNMSELETHWELVPHER